MNISNSQRKNFHARARKENFVFARYSVTATQMRSAQSRRRMKFAIERDSIGEVRGKRRTPRRKTRSQRQQKSLDRILGSSWRPFAEENLHIYGLKKKKKKKMKRTRASILYLTPFDRTSGPSLSSPRQKHDSRLSGK